MCIYIEYYTFERDHCLIDAVLMMRAVGFQESLFHLGDDRKHLLEPVISWLIPRRQGHVVSEVEIARYMYFLEPVSSDPGGDD